MQGQPILASGGCFLLVYLRLHELQKGYIISNKLENLPDQETQREQNIKLYFSNHNTVIKNKE